MMITKSKMHSPSEAVAPDGSQPFSAEPPRLRGQGRTGIAFLATALTLVLGSLWYFHDLWLLAAFVAAAGLLWSHRGRAAVALAVAIFALGVGWSKMDSSGCSAWWRGHAIYQKLSGELPFFAWRDIGRVAVGPCYTIGRPHPQVAASVVKVAEAEAEGRTLERYRTSLADFWIVAPGQRLLTFLLWEMTVQQDYAGAGVSIAPGDTVIDCGAHVGVFTRYALSRGAGQVIAIEPEPGNIACLKLNFASEIASGQVKLIEMGVWDRRTHLSLEHSAINSGAHTFGHDPAGTHHGENKAVTVPLLPLDEIVEELGLDRVDFIKMDIEGSERKALRGSLGVIATFRPKMAICVYHRESDPVVIPEIVRGAHPGYNIFGKDIEFLSGGFGMGRVTPKVLLFH